MLIYKQFIKPIPCPQQSGSFGLSHCLRQKEAKAIKKLDDPFWLTEITTKELLFSPRNLSSWSLKILGSLLFVFAQLLLDWQNQSPVPNPAFSLVAQEKPDGIP